MGPHNRILVTGGDGQVGRAFAKSAEEAVVLARRSLDVTDPSSVRRAIEEHQPGLIVNAAAYTKVDAAEDDPKGASAVNVDGPRNLASVAEETGARLVHISTDYVFDGLKTGAYVEDDDTGPASVYGRTKLEGERAALRNDNLVVRTSWVFGDGANFVRSVVNAARTRDVLTVVDDQWGLPTYAEDLASALLDLAKAEPAGGVYHLAGSGEPANWAEVAEVAIGAAGLTAKVQRVSTDVYYAGKQGPIAPRPANSVLDCSKAATLGVSLRPWRQAVVAYVSEYLKEDP